MHRITRFLRAARPNLYCHDCLAESLGLDSEVVRHDTLRLVETDGVKAEQGACTLCGREKTVIAAAA
jgi:hypothetical protein